MRNASEQITCASCRNFFGAITASLSHEMNNVLAIVNELAGLQEDVLAAADEGRPLSPEKLRSISSRIAQQVQRGKGFVKQLNRFAHSVDHASTQMDVREELERGIALNQRFARLRKVGLELRAPEATFSVQGCPFDVQHLVFSSIEIGLGVAAEGATLIVTLCGRDDGVDITLTVERAGECDPAAPAAEHPAEKLTYLRLLAEQLGGTCEGRLGAGDPATLTLRLPAVLAGFEDAEESEES